VSECHPHHPAVLPAWLAVAVAAALLLIPRTSRGAEEAPLLSMKRVSFATGMDHRWQPDRVSSWCVGAFGAYNLTPHSSLVASTIYDLKGERLEHRVGFRVRIFQGSK